MKMKNPFSLLAEERKDIQNKWWHRLAIVFYVLTLASIFVLSFLMSLITEIFSVQKTTKNIGIIANLNQFTQTSSSTIDNTIPFFLQKEGDLGCIKDNQTIVYLSSYTLENKSFCNADIKGNIDVAAEALSKIYSGTKNEAKSFISALLDEESKGDEKRYCFMSKDLNCNSYSTIKYKVNLYYYLALFGYPLLLATGIIFGLSLLLQLVYYKALIYIIYGKNK